VSDMNHPGVMDRPGITDEQPRRRSAAERFANLGDRIARSLPNSARPHEDDEPTRPLLSRGDYEPDDQLESWYDVVPRFPIARSGYDCAAVDEHIAMLEQELGELDHELADLRARTPAKDEVAVEIQRIGEETSAILLAAHDRAKETTRQAQEQADRCIADAAANAVNITAEANRQRDEIEDDVRRLFSERARLLADMETLAGTLATVAREAKGRFTPPAAAKPTPMPHAAPLPAESQTPDDPSDAG
jgi:hypothetical protein